LHLVYQDFIFIVSPDNNYIMKRIKIYLLFCVLAAAGMQAIAQPTELIPDLSKINTAQCLPVNRKAQIAGDAVYLDTREGDGLLIFKNISFSNGHIEMEIKGKNVMQQSFVGLAFHGLNDSTFDAVYFRPFNFKNSDRESHSVQYISMPEHDWYELRQNYPGKYENKLITIPDPDAWFHVSIQFNYPEVKVYVNNDKNPSLTVSQMSAQANGWVGFWVGNGSDGYFRNLKIYPK
jgi:hypothetical protein